MTDKDNEAVLAKIRKLLARADESRNDNPHEREIAMRQANALMAKHGIAAADVAGDTGDDAYGKLGVQETLYKGSPWRAALYGQMARLHGCQCLQYKYRGSNETKVYLIGRELRVQVALAMGQYVIDSILREANRTWREAGREGSGMGNGAWRAEFGKGAVSGVYQQVTRILEEQAKGNIPEANLSTSKAMVVASKHEQALVESREFMMEKYNVGKARGYKTKGTAANRQGYEYGKNVGLNEQLGGGARSKRLGKD
jgi:hypothetical protein